MTKRHSPVGQLVDVYFDLHRRNWSLRARTGPERGRLIAKDETVLLDDVQLVVQPSGMRRVRREKRKNVHAFARGRVVAIGNQAVLAGKLTRLTYDPYQHDAFVVRSSGNVVKSAQAALLRMIKSQPKLDVRL